MQATIELNGVRIFYDVDGDGPPVLLIMGVGTPHVGWDLQLEEFRGRYRAVTYDNRGCGRSACPAGAFSVRDMAEDAVALMSALHMKRAHVVGVSMGGMIAQEIALGWPERVGALVLASTFAAPSGEIRTLASESERYIKDPFAAMKRLVELTFSEDFIAREGGAIMQLFAKGSPNGPNLPGLMAQVGAVLQHDTRPRLGAIRSPTLVLTGDADLFIPPRLSDEIAREIPGARLETIAGGTHGVNFERPAEWSRLVLGFLAEHDALLAPQRRAAARH